MAFARFDYVRQRIREIVDDGAGLVRTVSSGRFSGDYWSGAGVEYGRARAIVKPRFAIPTMTYGPDAAQPVVVGSLELFDVSFALECEYSLAVSVDTDANKDAVIATAEQDADVISQALCWPGNMTTSAGGATGVVPGSVIFETFDGAVIEDWELRRLVTRVRFRCKLNVATAVA